MIIFSITLICAVGIYISSKQYIKSNEKPCIIRIPDTQEYDLRYNAYKEYYIIVNPHTDIQQLKEFVEE